ncbi:DUF4231 domain-containing protein [Grimontia marina]|nr:DUF4231 domain-containing protein [Grimontia marina]
MTYRRTREVATARRKCSTIRISYLDKSSWKFYATRVLSILIILLGAMLPVVAVFPTFFKDQRVWTVGIGAAIVLSQGILQTFHFEQSWRGQIVAQLELESALRQWQLSVVNLDGSNSEALDSLKKATLDFDKQVSSIVMNETAGFFDNVSKGTGALGSGVLYRS